MGGADRLLSPTSLLLCRWELQFSLEEQSQYKMFSVFIHVTTFVKGAVLFIRIINKDVKFGQSFGHVRLSFNPKMTQPTCLKADGFSRTLNNWSKL